MFNSVSELMSSDTHSVWSSSALKDPMIPMKRQQKKVRKKFTIQCQWLARREQTNPYDKSRVEKYPTGWTLIHQEIMFFSINTGSMGDGMVVMDMGGNSIESLPCEAGEEFSDYIREHLSPFPPCNPMLPGSSKDRTTLWPGRRVEFQVEKGKK